jgi:hypothetical protein
VSVCVCIVDSILRSRRRLDVLHWYRLERGGQPHTLIGCRVTRLPRASHATVTRLMKYAFFHRLQPLPLWMAIIAGIAMRIIMAEV